MRAHITNDNKVISLGTDHSRRRNNNPDEAQDYLPPNLARKFFIPNQSINLINVPGDRKTDLEGFEAGFQQTAPTTLDLISESPVKIDHNLHTLTQLQHWLKSYESIILEPKRNGQQPVFSRNTIGTTTQALYTFNKALQRVVRNQPGYTQIRNALDISLENLNQGRIDLEQSEGSSEEAGLSEKFNTLHSHHQILKNHMRQLMEQSQSSLVSKIYNRGIGLTPHETDAVKKLTALKVVLEKSSMKNHLRENHHEFIENPNGFVGRLAGQTRTTLLRHTQAVFNEIENTGVKMLKMSLMRGRKVPMPEKGETGKLTPLQQHWPAIEKRLRGFN